MNTLLRCLCCGRFCSDNFILEYFMRNVWVYIEISDFECRLLCSVPCRRILVNLRQCWDLYCEEHCWDKLVFGEKIWWEIWVHTEISDFECKLWYPWEFEHSWIHCRDFSIVDIIAQIILLGRPTGRVHIEIYNFACWLWCLGKYEIWDIFQFEILLRSLL